MELLGRRNVACRLIEGGARCGHCWALKWWTQAIELSVMVLRMVRTGHHLGLVEVLSQSTCDVETRL